MPESNNEYIKRRTLELYDSLPQDEEERKKHIEVRDEVIQLNYTFFGYVASHTYINNPIVTYEDKLQSALLHFCETWWWYKFAARYRTDLSFAVFYKPRLGEMIERELNQVKYSIRRSLCMEAGKQLGKHWGQVKYEDLKNVTLPADKMNALKAIFGSLYEADLEEHQLYLPSTEFIETEFSNPSDKFNTVEELLEYEMITTEEKITDSKLKEMSEIYGIDYLVLVRQLPIAEQNLYRKLHESLDIHE